jgi:hypothetical protein
MTKRKQVSDKERFLGNLRARAEQMANFVAEGEISPQFAALDLLAAIGDAWEQGVSTDELSETYPVADWRDRQISVPFALLRPIIESWIDYRWSEQQPTLEQAFRLGARSRGASPVRKRISKDDRDRKISGLVVWELVQAEKDNQPISQDAACATVAEKEGVPIRVVERAFQTRGKRVLEALKPRGE